MNITNNCEYNFKDKNIKLKLLCKKDYFNFKIVKWSVSSVFNKKVKANGTISLSLIDVCYFDKEYFAKHLSEKTEFPNYNNGMVNYLSKEYKYKFTNHFLKFTRAMSFQIFGY